MEKQCCGNCRFNTGTDCTVGTFYTLTYNRNVVCYKGELWSSKDYGFHNTNKNKGIKNE